MLTCNSCEFLIKTKKQDPVVKEFSLIDCWYCSNINSVVYNMELNKYSRRCIQHPKLEINRTINDLDRFV